MFGITSGKSPVSYFIVLSKMLLLFLSAVLAFLRRREKISLRLGPRRLL